MACIACNMDPDQTAPVGSSLIRVQSVYPWKNLNWSAFVYKLQTQKADSIYMTKNIGNECMLGNFECFIIGCWFSVQQFFKENHEHVLQLNKPDTADFLLGLILVEIVCFVCLSCCFKSQVNSYGHGGTVSSPNHTFSWASLNKWLTSTLCTYFGL